jgi:hypothetical protein
MPSANDGVYWDHYYPHLAGGGPVRAGLQQDRIENMLRQKLTEIAINRFEWTGFPDEVQLENIPWLEKSLFQTALCVFYYDIEWDRFMAMRAAPGGVWNFIGNPTKFLAYGNTYYNKWLDADDCVPIWANYLRYPDYEIVNIYAETLAEIDRTIRINAKNARRTKIIRVSEKSRLSFDNLQRQIDSGETFIKALPELPSLADAMEAIDLGIDPSSIMELSMLRQRVWSECMTMLGINNNAGADKKERLVASEVSGNDDQIATIRATNLKARQEAAAQIKDRYGFDVQVNYVTDMNSQDNGEGGNLADRQPAASDSNAGSN